MNLKESNFFSAFRWIC